MIEFIRALTSDAITVTRLRKRVWAETYRGIYPDEAIDSYCESFHLSRDLERIADPSHEVFLIKDGCTPIGYFSFIHNEKVHITSLYVLKEYKGLGTGRRALGLVTDFCRGHGFDSFTVNCNEHNLPARAFYEHMGGRLVSVDSGHENLQEDQVKYCYSLKSASEE